MGKIKTWQEIRENIKSLSDVEKKSMNIEAQIVAEIIKERTKLRLSQKELGQMAGVPQSTIARIETFQTSPRLETLCALCVALELELKLHSVDEKNKDTSKE